MGRVYKNSEHASAPKKRAGFAQVEHAESYVVADVLAGVDWCH
jgi:hypothetical protein